eukprot:CAMPEP_0182868996 /NCGR_PEP_ID=MMETSP0034_2-20130328/9656_1 /TAXON_ID=156128 /ORGANISM="Nephroselmis pyriformis, Strain CCMP717" /LENGTH=520 /DNA_ID=CAMNT_0025001431 /DNA_START=259 /DNA_END=1818 /DNA_ORIENTATION=-
MAEDQAPAAAGPEPETAPETNVKVAVRCRPIKANEDGQKSVFRKQMGGENEDQQQAVVEDPDTGALHTYVYDYVYDEESTQEQVYKDLGAPILDKAMDGFNGTIFAYGQTGSGKTWSMAGGGGDDLAGIVPRLQRSLFDRIKKETAEFPSRRFLVACSYFEIYNEIIRDLLDPRAQKAGGKGGGPAPPKLEIREHKTLGVYVQGLKELVVDSAEKIDELLQQGNSVRAVGSTSMNDQSSRSHSIFMVKIHQKDAEDKSKNVFAKLNLVDLAGSERVSKTGATGDRLKEGANINKSLAALGSVINALSKQAGGSKKEFIPYRNSKLTRVLQESLGGNALTVMLAALSPAAMNYQETISTLVYANRAKEIKVSATKNEDTAQMNKLKEEIEQLKKKMQEEMSSAAGRAEEAVRTEMEERHKAQLAEIEAMLAESWEDKQRISREAEEQRQAALREKELEMEAKLKDKDREEKLRRWARLQQGNDEFSTIELMLRELPGLEENVDGWGARMRELQQMLQGARE